MSTNGQETRTWYRVSRYFDLGKIEPREVLRTTGKFVVFTIPGFKGPKERREGLDTEYYSWVPTEEEAVALARTLLTSRRDKLRGQLDRADESLTAFNAAHPLESHNQSKEGEE